jgi:hypothetical protein
MYVEYEQDSLIGYFKDESKGLRAMPDFVWSCFPAFTFATCTARAPLVASILATEPMLLAVQRFLL